MMSERRTWVSQGPAILVVITGSVGGINHSISLNILKSDASIPNLEHVWGTDLNAPDGFTLCDAGGVVGSPCDPADGVADLGEFERGHHILLVITLVILGRSVDARKRNAVAALRSPYTKGALNRAIAACVAGRTPRHQAKASAACSTSMPTPSARRITPAAWASRRKGVRPWP